MYDVARAGANPHREEKDLIREEFLAVNPLEHTHLGQPLQVDNQVHVGHPMPASLVRGYRVPSLVAVTQNELFTEQPVAEESKKDRTELFPIHTGATSGISTSYWLRVFPQSGQTDKI